MDGLVLRTLTCQQALVALRRAFHQHVDRASQIALVRLERALLHEIHQAVETLLDHLARCVVVHGRSRRALALRIDEREHLVVAHLVHEAVRVLEVLGGLAGESDDDVGGQRDVGYGVTQLRDKRAVMIARVAAVHGRKHRIRARLHGKVQRRHERAQRGEPADDLVVEVLRVAGGEPQALDARLVERVQHLGEARRAVQVAPVGVHVLPQQRDLLHAGGHIALGLGHDVLQRPRLLASAHIRNDAVRAEVVAADGDGQPCRPFVLARRRQLGGER